MKVRLMQRTSKAVLIAAVLFFTILRGATAAAAPGKAQSVEDQVDRYLQSEMRERGIPGMQLAVVKRGKIVMLKSFGLAELPHSIPVTNRSVFSINSATKSFTGGRDHAVGRTRKAGHGRASVTLYP